MAFTTVVLQKWKYTDTVVMVITEATSLYIVQQRVLIYFKKAVEKFRIHENSDSHLEARIKCRSLNNPSTNEQLSSQAAKVQAIRWAGLMKQLEAMKFLLIQGIALRGHSEEEGNLYQLLTTWSSDCADTKSWIEKGKYMSHLITLMGHDISR